jgi:putative membrane protein
MRSRDSLRSVVVEAVKPTASGIADGRCEQRGAPNHAPRVEPDPRFRFANERTYLAWNRTGLALIAGGLAVSQFLKVGVSGAQLIVALPLIAFGASLSYRSFRHWQRNERALRLAEPLPESILPRVLVYGVSIFGVAAAALAILHFASS